MVCDYLSQSRWRNSSGLKAVFLVAVLSVASDVSNADEQAGLKTRSISPHQDSQIGHLAPQQGGAPPSGLISTGGWKSEEIAEAAKKNIKRLTKLLGPKHSQEIPAFVSPTFTSSELRPARLVPVFQDSSLTVLSAAANQPNATETRSGLDQIQQVFHRMGEPLKNAAKLSVRIKVFKVEMKDRTATTHLFVQTLARGSLQENSAAGSTVQQDATWICRWKLTEKDKFLKLESIDVVAFQEIVLATGRRRLFSDCTESLLGGTAAWGKQLSYGVDHWRARILRDFEIGVYGYEGIALGDVNGDGLEDAYVCQPGGLPNRLFVHQQDGTVIDQSADSRIDFLDVTTNALFIDLDNDGDQDLILGVDKTVAVFANNGRGQFTRKATLPVGGNPASLAAADYDGDSRLDFYVCGYGSDSPLRIYDANNGAQNFLFRNAGNWQFHDVTNKAGLDTNNRRFSFAASWEDFDNDGDPDLYVANDFGRNNLYRNDNGRFADVTPEAGVEDSSAGMSVTWGDYNNDGWMDLYVSNMFSSAGNRVAYQRRFKPGVDDLTLAEIRRHARGNSLFQNMGDGTFRDVSVEAGVTMGRWAWTSLFVDLNNDGWEDIYVVNGYVTQEDNGDL